MAATTGHQTVTVIGTGAMGTALAKAFLAKDCRVTVWNRTAKKCKPFEDAGATVAASMAEAVAASRVIVVWVINYDVSDSLLRKKVVSAELGGKVLVDAEHAVDREAPQHRQAPLCKLGEW